MKSIFVSLFIIFSVCGFSQKTTISGMITGFKDGTKIYLGDLEMGDIIQEGKIENNQFTFKNPSTFSPKKLYIDIKEDTTYYSMFFYVDNKSVKLFGDKTDFPNNIKVTGSKSYDENKLFEKSYQKLQFKKDSINELIDEKLKDTIKHSKNEIDNDRLIRKKLNEQIEDVQLANVKIQPNTYIAVMFLSYFRDRLGKSEVSKLYNQLDDKLKQSVDGKGIKVYLELVKVLNEGDYYQDFTAKDVNNVLHKFSDYVGKKYILLDFIQTSCYYCVISYDELKNINEKYKNDLQIVTFSGDQAESTWKIGYKEYNIPWVSLWNGEGIMGKVPQTYGTDGTPTFILINPEGKIIKKQYGYEEGLLDKILEETIAKK